MLTSGSAPEAKSRLRRAVRTRRCERLREHPSSAGAGRAGSAADVAGLVPGVDCLGAYLSAVGEPDPIEAMSVWHASGITVLVPLSLPGRRLDWVEWSPGLPVRLGAVAPVPEPVGGTPADPRRMGLIVVPALAVGRDGTRLGQGGGFYDSFLAGHPDITTVGCIFDDELMDSVPAEEWDAVLDAAWTPGGVRRLPL